MHPFGPPSLDYPLVIHSPLYWDHAGELPQQFLARFSKQRPVLYVEAPMPVVGIGASRAAARHIAEFPNVTVLSMQMPVERWTDSAWMSQERLRLMQETLAGPLGQRFQNAAQWFYDPAAVSFFAPAQGEKSPVASPADLSARIQAAAKAPSPAERTLFSVGLLYAGGPKAHRAKASHGGGADSPQKARETMDFDAAYRTLMQVPEDLAALPAPRFGFFGDITDEVDCALLATLADAQKQGSVIVVGSTKQVAPDRLPERANLHFFGPRSRQLLPACCKGFDVCLLPFASDADPASVDPVTVREYVAAGKPVVSSINLEAAGLLFEDVVHIASFPGEFIDLCLAATRHADPFIAERIAWGLTLIAQMAKPASALLTEAAVAGSAAAAIVSAEAVGAS